MQHNDKKNNKSHLLKDAHFLHKSHNSNANIKAKQFDALKNDLIKCCDDYLKIPKRHFISNAHADAANQVKESLSKIEALANEINADPAQQNQFKLEAFNVIFEGLNNYLEKNNSQTFKELIQKFTVTHKHQITDLNNTKLGLEDAIKDYTDQLNKNGFLTKKSSSTSGLEKIKQAFEEKYSIDSVTINFANNKK